MMKDSIHPVSRYLVCPLFLFLCGAGCSPLLPTRKIPDEIDSAGLLCRNEWRGANGLRLVFDDADRLRFSDAGGNSLLASYRMEYDSTPSQRHYTAYAHYFVLQVEFDEKGEGNAFSRNGRKQAVVPLAFYSGEGGASRLTILDLCNELGVQLRKHMGITNEALRCRGPNVDGSW